MASASGRAVRAQLQLDDDAVEQKQPQEPPRASPRSGSKHRRRGAFLKTASRAVGQLSRENLLAEAVPDLPPDEPVVPLTVTRAPTSIDTGHLTRPGQTIVDALKETTASVSNQLEKHYPGWTPARDLAAQVHQKKKLNQTRREQGLAAEELEPSESPRPTGSLFPPRLEQQRQTAEPSHGGSSLMPPRKSAGSTRPSSPSPEGILRKKSSMNRSASPLPEEVDPREEELRKQMEKAGEPGSIFWNPRILKSHIQDIVEQLNTAGMEDLLGEQLEVLKGVVIHNSGLEKEMKDKKELAQEHHASVNSIYESLESRVQKSQQKTELTLQSCQATGKQMVAVINAAMIAREKVRQLLLNDAEIVVTEEKKAILEERRRQGQALASKKMAMAKQEEEDGIGGVKEPPAIADLRRRIERKTRKQTKLKVEHDQVQVRLKSLEQVLEVVERGQRPDKVQALDPLAMEMLEEAKGHGREIVIAPYLEELKREQGLSTPKPVEMPDELIAERDWLEQQIAEVEAEIAKIEDFRQEQEGQRTAAANTLSAIEFDDERRLASFCAKRRRSYLGVMQVEPPIAGNMPDFDVERSEYIKSGLRRKCREAHAEMAGLVDRLPKYLALTRNARESAAAMSQQRQKFIDHIKSLKPKFLRDLRQGGAKKLKQDIETKLDEETLMKQVEDSWDKEEARLCSGHLALEKRAEFFGTISDEVAEEVSKLQESIERSRWALEDKMAPADVGEGEPSDPFLEADDGELASFLAFQESEAALVRNALSAFRSHNEAVVQRFADEGEQAEAEFNREFLEELETKKVMRDVRLSELKERRNSMVARRGAPGAPQRIDSVSLEVSSARGSSNSSRESSKDRAKAEDAPAAGPDFLDPRLERTDTRESRVREPAGKVLSSSGLSLSLRAPSSPRASRKSSLGSASKAGSDSDEGSLSQGGSSACSPTPSRGSPSPALGRSPRKRGTQVGRKKQPQAKKRSAKRAATAAPRLTGPCYDGGKSTRDFVDDDEEDDAPEDDLLSRRASMQSVGQSSVDPNSQEGLSEQLKRFLKMDKDSQRLEEKVREGAERLTYARAELVSDSSSPLDLSRLKNLTGDERTKALAQDSLSDLRQKWQTILDRRTTLEAELPAAAAVRQAGQRRSRTEEEAFQETYQLLLSEIQANAASAENTEA